jgi:hypothetical protein
VLLFFGVERSITYSCEECKSIIKKNEKKKIIFGESEKSS